MRRYASGPGLNNEGFSIDRSATLKAWSSSLRLPKATSVKPSSGAGRGEENPWGKNDRPPIPKEETPVDYILEKRLDPSDGNAYTRAEFIEFYGSQDGIWYWEGATPSYGPPDDVDNSVNRRITGASNTFGSLKRWHRRGQVLLSNNCLCLPGEAVVLQGGCNYTAVATTGSLSRPSTRCGGRSRCLRKLRECYIRSDVQLPDLSCRDSWVLLCPEILSHFLETVDRCGVGMRPGTPGILLLESCVSYIMTEGTMHQLRCLRSFILSAQGSKRKVEIFWNNINGGTFSTPRDGECPLAFVHRSISHSLKFITNSRDRFHGHNANITVLTQSASLISMINSACPLSRDLASLNSPVNTRGQLMTSSIQDWIQAPGIGIAVSFEDVSFCKDQVAVWNADQDEISAQNAIKAKGVSSRFSSAMALSNIPLSLSEEDVSKLLKSGKLVSGIVDVKKKQNEAYVKLDKSCQGHSYNRVLVPMQQLIDARATHGDHVAVKVLDETEWGISLSHYFLQYGEERDERAMPQIVGDSKVATGHVVRVLWRGWRPFVCTLSPGKIAPMFDVNHDVGSVPNKNRFQLFVPMDPRIPKIRVKTAQREILLGQRVIVHIDRWQKDSKYPEGHYTEILGCCGNRNTEIKALLVENGLAGHAKAHPSNAIAELPDKSWSVARSIQEDPTVLDRRKDCRETYYRTQDTNLGKSDQVDRTANRWAAGWLAIPPGQPPLAGKRRLYFILQNHVVEYFIKDDPKSLPQGSFVCTPDIEIEKNEAKLLLRVYPRGKYNKVNDDRGKRKAKKTDDVEYEADNSKDFSKWVEAFQAVQQGFRAVSLLKIQLNPGQRIDCEFKPDRYDHGAIVKRFFNDETRLEDLCVEVGMSLVAINHDHDIAQRPFPDIRYKLEKLDASRVRTLEFCSFDDHYDHYVRDIVVNVGPGNLGVKLKPDANGDAAEIKKFEVLEDGTRSDLEGGGVKSGMVLVAIDKTPVYGISYTEVMALLKSHNEDESRRLYWKDKNAHYHHLDEVRRATANKYRKDKGKSQQKSTNDKHLLVTASLRKLEQVMFIAGPQGRGAYIYRLESQALRGAGLEIGMSLVGIDGEDLKGESYRVLMERLHTPNMNPSGPTIMNDNSKSSIKIIHRLRFQRNSQEDLEMARVRINLTYISFKDFAHVFSLLSSRASPDEKLQFLASVMDTDCDGHTDHEDFFLFYKALLGSRTSDHLLDILVDSLTRDPEGKAIKDLNGDDAYMTLMRRNIETLSLRLTVDYFV